ncbi:MAG: hypothetical protein NC347_15365 [Clostridium sp.]|nr:hypothetical protein [Clostridium sp.]
MKNYEEMAESVLERRDRYVADRKRKIWKTASMVSCFCFIAVLGTGIWYAGILNDGLDIANGDTAGGGYQNEEVQTGGILPGGATIGDTIDNGADIKKEMQELAGDERDGNPAGYPPLTTNAPQQSDEISETDPLDTDVEEYQDKPAEQNPGNTGELIEYEAVWGGSYMDEAGCWVVLLTENTAENQKKVFELNPSLTENNTIFQTAAYSLTYLTNLMEKLSKADLPLVVSSIGLREERNRIEVIITTDNPDAVAEILAYDSIGGAIEIICLSDIQIDEKIIK